MTGACLICRRPQPGYEPRWCCNGADCACGGEPVNPCVCGFRCMAALIEGDGAPYEARRLAAGIPLWEPGPPGEALK